MITVNCPQPSIAVIVPVYNCHRFLKQAVDSVLQQPFQNIDLILVDDGSTDGSSLLCDRIAQTSDRIRVIHKENGGVSSARNVGLADFFSNVSGDITHSYIAFLDADDAWADSFFTGERIESLVKDYDLIGFSSCMCNHQLTCRSKPKPLIPAEYQGGVSSLWIYPGHFAAMLYRAAFLKAYDLHFYPISASEDKVFLMQCLYLADRIKLDDNLLYYYRQHSASAVHTRVMGIKYYGPIIDAYLKSDVDMARWKTAARGELKEGRTLAKIYIEEMACEHCKIGGTKEQMARLLEEKPVYLKIRPDAPQLIHQLWVPKTIFKNQARRFVVCVGKAIYSIPFVRKLADRWRYPVRLAKR